MKELQRFVDGLFEMVGYLFLFHLIWLDIDNI